MYKISFLRTFYKIYKTIYSETLFNKITSPLDKVLIEIIQVHDFDPNALKTRMNWQENVSEERDAPWQIVLGAMDTTYCVLTCLALWSELHA